MKKSYYICDCGKEFTNPQSFNGHKRHCVIHLGKDRYEELKTKDIDALSLATKKFIDTIPSRYTYITKTCLFCKKEFVCVPSDKRKYCSRKCANKVIGFNKRKPRAPKKSRIIYQGPELPEIEKESLKPGWQSRCRWSYAEKFWAKVFENNNIEYLREFNIKCEHPGAVYKLDFLIDNLYDIEIDSKLHDSTYSIEKDKRRTQYLESLGYKVYRIRWINPNSEHNKILVNNQIQELFDYLGKKRVY